MLRGIDIRSQLLDVEDVLQGDRYAAIRDIYLQRKNYEIAQKKALMLKSLLLMMKQMMKMRILKLSRIN